MLTPFVHSVTQDRSEDAPAYLSNGLVGLRVEKIPLLSDTATVNGFTGYDRFSGVEAAAPAPYPLGMDVRIGHVWMSHCPGSLRLVEQRYDFSCGELSTHFEIQFEGITAQVEMVTFCSRTQPTVVAQSLMLRTDRDCRLILRARIDPTCLPGRLLAVEALPAGGPADARLRWGSEDGTSCLGMAFAALPFGSPSTRREVPGWEPTQAVCADHVFEARAGEPCGLHMLAALVPDLLHQDGDRQAVRMISLARSVGFDGLRNANSEAWSALWKGRVRLNGAGDAWQSMADAAFYYLHASVHPAMPANTGLFGVARWRNYHYFNGHAFWDLETFALPPLLLSAPDCAQAMLDYRFRHLDAARRNAAMNGWRGIQFPWQSSPRTGEETTPVMAENVFSEHHVTLDVALAFARAWHVGGDPEFMRERAWPVLRGAAEWITSRVKKTVRGYEIHGVTGIDEGLSNVNNNSYTNLAAMQTLREAAQAARLLGLTPPPVWQAVADGMVLPYLPGSRVLNKHEGFVPGGQGLCPDPLAALFPLGCRLDAEVERDSLRFYLEHCEGYVGYPMLSAPMGVYAAWLGERELSLQLFQRGVADFVFDPYLLIDEWGAPFTQAKEKVGPYLAHAGCFLMDLLYGLPGLSLDAGDPQAWAARPVTLPAGWESIEVERVWLRGRLASLTARHGAQRAAINWLEEG